MSAAPKPGDFYVYQDEDQNAVAVAIARLGPNGGQTATSICRMSLPSKALTQRQINQYAAMFAAVPQLLAALGLAATEMRAMRAAHGPGLVTDQAIALAEAALDKAEGRS